MDVTRQIARVEEEKWARFRYSLTTGIGENGERITGSEQHLQLSREVAAEGMVLLENSGILPLRENTCVALFGISTLDYVKCGTGSGRVFNKHAYNLYEGLSEKAPRVSIYEPVSRFYYDYIQPQLATYSSEELFPELDVPRTLIDEAAENASVAVISIRRLSGEGKDRSGEKGDFLLSDTEERLIREVTDDARYKNARLAREVPFDEIGG